MPSFMLKQYSKTADKGENVKESGQLLKLSDQLTPGKQHETLLTTTKNEDQCNGALGRNSMFELVEKIKAVGVITQCDTSGRLFAYLGYEKLTRWLEMSGAWFLFCKVNSA